MVHAVGLFDTFAATPAGLAHDVTDTECWAQNGSTHSRVSMNFKCLFIY